MIRVGIDLDYVIRDYKRRYLFFWGKEHGDSELEGVMNEEDISKYDIEKGKYALEGKDKVRFVYEDYALELKGNPKEVHKGSMNLINAWSHRLEDEFEGEIEFMFISPMEMGVTISANYFFLSRYGTHIREMYMPKHSEDVWKRCDVVISANDIFLKSKPEGKVAIGIQKSKNEPCSEGWDKTYEDIKKLTEIEKLDEYKEKF